MLKRKWRNCRPTRISKRTESINLSLLFTEKYQEFLLLARRIVQVFINFHFAGHNYEGTLFQQWDIHSLCLRIPTDAYSGFGRGDMHNKKNMLLQLQVLNYKRDKTR